MNLSGGEKNYKKWILIIGLPLLIVAVILYLFLNDGLETLGFTSPDKPKVQIDKGENTGAGSFNPQNEVVPEEPKPEIAVLNPPINKQGKLTKVSNKGTYADLKIGKGKKAKTFKLVSRSIVFNSDLSKVVLPSDIKAGQGVSIYATPETELSDGKKETALAELVVTGSEKVEYAPVLDVVKTDKAVYLVNTLSKTKYKLPKDASIKNAFTGYYMYPSEIDKGDGLFLYLGKQSSSDKHKKVSTKGTLLPKELKEKKLKVESGSDIKSYKEKSIRKVVVYPFNR